MAVLIQWLIPPPGGSSADGVSPVGLGSGEQLPVPHPPGLHCRWSEDAGEGGSEAPDLRPREAQPQHLEWMAAVEFWA